MIPFLSFTFARPALNTNVDDSPGLSYSATSVASRLNPASCVTQSSTHHAYNPVTTGEEGIEMASPQKKWRCPDCDWVNGFANKKCDMCSFTISSQNGDWIFVLVV